MWSLKWTLGSSDNIIWVHFLMLSPLDMTRPARQKECPVRKDLQSLQVNPSLSASAFRFSPLALELLDKILKSDLVRAVIKGSFIGVRWKKFSASSIGNDYVLSTMQRTSKINWRRHSITASEAFAICP